MNPCSWQWKHRVLATGTPGNSHTFSSYEHFFTKLLGEVQLISFFFFFLLWINFLATSLRTLNLALVPKDLLPFSSKGFIALHFTSNLPILHSLNHYHSINHYIIIIKLNQAHWTLFSKTIQLIVNCSTNSSFVFPFKF